MLALPPACIRAGIALYCNQDSLSWNRRRRKTMPIFYRIDKARRLVLSTSSGAFTLADALSHQEKLSADPDFDPSFSQIADLTNSTQFDISPDEIRQLARRNIFSPQSRRALIVSNDLAFGLARMFEILRENLGESGIRVFRSLDEALNWALTPIKPE